MMWQAQGHPFYGKCSLRERRPEEAHSAPAPEPGPPSARQRAPAARLAQCEQAARHICDLLAPFPGPFSWPAPAVAPQHQRSSLHLTRSPLHPWFPPPRLIPPSSMMPTCQPRGRSSLLQVLHLQLLDLALQGGARVHGWRRSHMSTWQVVQTQNSVRAYVRRLYALAPPRGTHARHPRTHMRPIPKCAALQDEWG